MVFEQEFSAQEQVYLSTNNTVGEGGESGSLRRQPHMYAATFEEIWRAHAKQILRVTQRITNNREDAEDALQDSFLRAYVHLHSFDGRASLATWLTRIAINSALMILRKRNHSPQLLSLDTTTDSGTNPHDLVSSDQDSGPEGKYAEVEQQSIVRDALATLRPSIRRPLELQIEERPIKEVAEAMGLSVSATKSRLFHAKAALRKSLEEKVRHRSRRAKQMQLSPA
jgi:RNA polymerase sigma factor (sigma-70 family)